MRYILFTLSLLFTLSSNAQISKQESSSVEVGVAKNFGVTIATMSKVSGDPDYYFVTYNNLKYTSITDVKSFGFNDVDGAFETLYIEILNGFKNKSKRFELNVDDGTLSIQYSMGSFRFYFIDSAGIESWTGYITKKQFSTLFGKKYNKADFKK
tara:strand:- start:8 stop:469 length:462 start_codon:yes stop_codon:yes gene_type:complete